MISHSYAQSFFIYTQEIRLEMEKQTEKLGLRLETSLIFSRSPSESSFLLCLEAPSSQIPECILVCLADFISFLYRSKTFKILLSLDQPSGF